MNKNSRIFSFKNKGLEFYMEYANTKTSPKRLLSNGRRRLWILKDTFPDGFWTATLQEGFYNRVIKMMVYRTWDVETSKIVSLHGTEVKGLS